MAEQIDVIVVGGGAAGIIAAGQAAEMRKKVLLIEKNDRLGMKILISGGGKCNLTHDGTMEELRAKFRPNEARFLKPSFYKFTNKQFLSILHKRGMSTYVRPDGRVFPIEPANARDVVSILGDYINDQGVTVRYSSAVSGIATADGVAAGVYVGDEFLPVQSVVLAAGGSSYPGTGATGDGWRWVKELGHTIVPLRAALAPISLVDSHPEWAGVALRDVILKARDRKQGKEFVRFSGDVLYTHKGISGPTTLGISRDVAERLVDGQTVPFIEADLVPDITFDALRDDLRNEALGNPRRTAAAMFARFLPSRLLPVLFQQSGIDLDLKVGQLPAKSLTRIVTMLKEWPFGEPSNVPLERGEVVAGGVSLDEVDHQTMESKLIKNLYLCGEVLDIAGPVGGYNLQAAWSTGYVAGINVS